MKVNSMQELETQMSLCWQDILGRPLAKKIESVLASGDRTLYALWLVQVAHLTKHTSAHQALVGTRNEEISYLYQKFCFEHALEEVGHEMMAVHDLKKIGAPVSKVSDLPPPLASTEKLNAYLYYASERAHPNTRLGFSYWAEKCYPFLQGIVSSTQKTLGLENKQMTFFVSHSTIDEKHSQDVERIIGEVCKTSEDWQAVATGLVDSLEMAVGIFAEIHDMVEQSKMDETYTNFLKMIQQGK